MRPSLYH